MTWVAPATKRVEPAESALTAAGAKLAGSAVSTGFEGTPVVGSSDSVVTVSFASAM
jgi:hypothetical protein